MRRGRLLAASSILLGLGLCGAGPAPEGTEGRGALGVGWFEGERGGCGGSPTYLYRTQHLSGQAGVRHRFRGSGGLLSASFGATYLHDVDDQLVDPGTDNPTDPAPPEYQSHVLLAGALRGGWQWSWIGGEAGFIWGGETGEKVGTPLPSGVIWVAPTDALHIYASLLEDPAVYLRGVVRFGFGYAFDRWSFGLSVGAMWQYGSVGTAEAELQLTDALALGLGLSLQAEGELGPEMTVFVGPRYLF